MDDRFAGVFKDPRFQQVPVKERKLKIDKRFKGMFNDKRFSLKYTIDKRGRPINSSTNENLQKYYNLSDDDDDDDDEEDEKEMDDFSNKEDKKKTKLKRKHKDVKKEKKLVNSKTKIDDGVILKSKNNVMDSLLKNKKIQSFERKKEIDEVGDNLKRKRQLSSEDTEFRGNMKKKFKNQIMEEVKGDEEAAVENNVSENEEENDEESEDSESGLGSGPDLARGIGNETSSSDISDSDSQSDDEALVTEEIVHDWGEFDKNVHLTTDLSRRLALCNMDWDNITATDLFVALNSFKPPESTVLYVKIYLSEYGKQRLEEEAIKGPAELAEIACDTNCSEDDEINDQENDEGNSFHNEKLRQYQLNRMKYYYAVIKCDTIKTANRIYNELDGAEYESSKTCFDLRFIPDDMEFNEEVKDICTELPSKDLYKPNQFLNVALSEAEVSLTWDETDKKRLETTTKNYSKKNDIKLEDFKDYLALSSEEEAEDKIGSDISLISDNKLSDVDDANSEEESKSAINKYKILLEGIEESEKKKEEKQIEVIWDIGLKGKTEVLKKKEKKKSSSPWNEFLDKLKQKQKKRKAKLKALKKIVTDAQETLSDDELPPEVDFNNPYFSSELLSDQRKSKESKRKKKKEKKADRLKKLQGEIDSYSGLTTEEVNQKKQELAELVLLMADEDDVNQKSHFDYEKIIKQESKKSKKKTKVEKLGEKDDFKLDLNDDRFCAIYTSSAFNIDKSAPEYKKSTAMEALIEEKMRRRYIGKECLENEQKPMENSKAKLSLDEQLFSQPSTCIDKSVSSLVCSIKTKTKNFNFSKAKPNVKSATWKKLPKDL